MADEKPPSSETPSGGKGRRRPPTIDLTASEIESKSDVSGWAPPAPEPPADHAHPTTPSGGAAMPPSSEPDVAASALKHAATAPSPAADAVAGKSPWAAEPPAAAPADRKPSLAVPLIGAGLAGGSAAAIAFLLASHFSPRDNSANVADPRLVQIEQQVRDLAARPQPLDAKALDDLASRLAKIETAIATTAGAAADPAHADRIAAIEGEARVRAETIGNLGRRSDEAVAAAREARQRADATAAALAQLTQTAAGPPTIERGELEALANRVAAVERGEKAMQAELAKHPPAEAGDRAVRLAVAATALAGAVERGEPFAAALATAKSLAADAKPLAALEPFAVSGVPTSASLARALAQLAPALQASAGEAPRNGVLEKLAAGAEKLVRIRPLGDVPGSDPAAIVSRIEAKAAHADLAGALAELSSLPANVRAPAEAWIKQVEARMAAIEASRRLAGDALSGLAK